MDSKGWEDSLNYYHEALQRGYAPQTEKFIEAIEWSLRNGRTGQVVKTLDILEGLHRMVPSSWAEVRDILNLLASLRLRRSLEVASNRLEDQDLKNRISVFVADLGQLVQNRVGLQEKVKKQNEACTAVLTKFLHGEDEDKNKP